MRAAFAHEAVLAIEPNADIQAPGAAITVELCGHWEHQPPCPLAPHHSHAERVGDEVHLRILFAVEPDLESVVRRRIGMALSSGKLRGPGGGITRWRLLASDPSPVRAEEADHVGRLTRD